MVEVGSRYKETLERLKGQIRNRDRDLSTFVFNSREVVASCYSCREGTIKEKQVIGVKEKREGNDSIYFFHPNCYLDIMNS